MSERLKETRLGLKLSQGTLASTLGVPEHKIRDTESGKTKLSPWLALLIERKFYISSEWLLSGKGQKMIEKPSMVANPPLSDDDRVPVPYMPETYAGAGGGAINYDNGVEAMTFSREFLRGHLGLKQYTNLHIINAVGNSMEPLIKSGELLFVLPIENEGGAITSGAVYVVNIDNSVLVKRLEHNPKTKAITLISDNKDYAPVAIEGNELDSCIVIGRVVGHFDRI
jgi:phage repressor protein C with HTH and peptisase S24 domain